MFMFMKEQPEIGWNVKLTLVWSFIDPPKPSSPIYPTTNGCESIGKTVTFICYYQVTIRICFITNKIVERMCKRSSEGGAIAFRTAYLAYSQRMSKLLNRQMLGSSIIMIKLWEFLCQLQEEPWSWARSSYIVLHLLYFRFSWRIDFVA